MELNRNELSMYSSAVNALTVFVFMEMELRNYDPQQKKLVQNLFAQVIDRAKTDFPLDEISAAVTIIPLITKSQIKWPTSMLEVAEDEGDAKDLLEAAAVAVGSIAGQILQAREKAAEKGESKSNPEKRPSAKA